jgi:hypothetical protein
MNSFFQGERIVFIFTWTYFSNTKNPLIDGKIRLKNKYFCIYPDMKKKNQIKLIFCRKNYSYNWTEKSINKNGPIKGQKNARKNQVHDRLMPRNLVNK